MPGVLGLAVGFACAIVISTSTTASAAVFLLSVQVSTLGGGDQA